MKGLLTFLVAVTAMSLLNGCASNPNKAKKIKTNMERHENVQGESVGIKNGEMVIQKKQDLAEAMRRLQVSVYELEDKVYGNEERGSWGLYGVLKDCRMKLSSKKFGGNGHLMWMEKIDRVTDREDNMKVGLDEKNDLVAMKQEYLLDRIKRFQRYKKILVSRENDFNTKIDICKTDLASRIHDMKEKDKNKTE